MASPRRFPARGHPERSSGRRSVPARVLRAWEELSDEIRACQKCPLGKTRTQAVVYRGGLAPRVVFVGEAPGVAEDREGVPFVGRSGKRLDAAIALLDLSEGKFGVLNVLKCHPPGNRFDRAAARTCRPYLDRQLALLRPRALVTLGSSALKAVDPSAPPMLTAAGQVRSAAGLPVFPLIHPAATLRSRRLAARWARDVKSLRRWLASPDL